MENVFLTKLVIFRRVSGTAIQSLLNENWWIPCAWWRVHCCLGHRLPSVFTFMYCYVWPVSFELCCLLLAEGAVTWYSFCCGAIQDSMYRLLPRVGYWWAASSADQPFYTPNSLLVFASFQPIVTCWWVMDDKKLSIGCRHISTITFTRIVSWVPFRFVPWSPFLVIFLTKIWIAFPVYCTPQ